MYSVFDRFGRRDGFNGFAFNRGFNDGCGFEKGRCDDLCNWYCFEPPLVKRQRRLDAIELIIHTDEFVRREAIKRADCCPPEPVVIEDRKMSFIIQAVTECIEPGVQYTLQIDRKVPFEVDGLDTFINVKRCGFFRGEVGFKKTKMIHGGFCGGNWFGDGFDGVRDGDRIDGEVGRNFERDKFVEAHGFVPADPAFPGQNIRGFHDVEERLIPVKLDLNGDICTGENFFNGRFKVPGTGIPYSNRFVLFLNNSGEFVLRRTCNRVSDFA